MMTSKALGLTALAALVAASTAGGAEVVRVVRWDGDTGVPPAPEVRALERDDSGLLEVSVSAPEGRVVPLVRLAKPGVGAPGWRVEGEATFSRLEGTVQVEMWAEFPDGGRYFSRAPPWSGEGGGSVTHDRLDFALPFRLDGTSPPPVVLDVNLVVRGAATVHLGPLSVVQLELGESLLARPEVGWWSDRQAALLGGSAGTCLGLLGALLGILMARGVGLKATSRALLAIGLGGVAALLVGCYALASGQPYAVWFPLGLLGLIAAVVGLALRLVARQRLTMLEEQRMRAADL